MVLKKSDYYYNYYYMYSKFREWHVNPVEEIRQLGVTLMCYCQVSVTLMCYCHHCHHHHDHLCHHCQANYVCHFLRVACQHLGRGKAVLSFQTFCRQLTSPSHHRHHHYPLCTMLRVWHVSIVEEIWQAAQVILVCFYHWHCCHYY